MGTGQVQVGLPQQQAGPGKGVWVGRLVLVAWLVAVVVGWRYLQGVVRAGQLQALLRRQ